MNLKGTFNCRRAVLPVMRRQNYAKIVNTSSISSLGNPGQVNYSAAKAGISAMTRTIALETARNGTNVNCVAPGMIDTPMSQGMPADILRDMVEKRNPLRRVGRPEEIASIRMYLVSDDASYVTGQTRFVDGGVSVGF